MTTYINWPSARKRIEGPLREIIDNVQNNVYFDPERERIAMSTTTLPVTEAKQRFTELVRASEELFDRYLITRNGKDAALLMSAEEYANLLETIDVLANTREVKALAEATEQVRKKKTLPLTEYLSRKASPRNEKRRR